jgi:hypothetical protein
MEVAKQAQRGRQIQAGRQGEVGNVKRQKAGMSGRGTCRARQWEACRQAWRGRANRNADHCDAVWSKAARARQGKREVCRQGD